MNVVILQNLTPNPKWTWLCWTCRFHFQKRWYKVCDKTKLMSACASSIKYTGKQDKPACLIDRMMCFAVDFLTITPLTQNQLQRLGESSSTHWDHVLAFTSDSEDTRAVQTSFRFQWLGMQQGKMKLCPSKAQRSKLWLWQDMFTIWCGAMQQWKQ